MPLFGVAFGRSPESGVEILFFGVHLVCSERLEALMLPRVDALRSDVTGLRSDPSSALILQARAVPSSPSQGLDPGQLHSDSLQYSVVVPI